MSEPVAKKDDHVVGLDTHIVLVSGPSGAVPTPMSLPFDGPLGSGLSSTVFVDGKPVAVVGSEADNTPVHVPLGGSFQRQPSNRATVDDGSATIIVDGKKLARNNDPARCCNDGGDARTGHVVASGIVIAG